MHVWCRKRQSKLLGNRNLCSKFAGSPLNLIHGIEHYKFKREYTSSWPKVMLDPDKTYAHHVHDALDLPGFAATRIDESCMQVMHILNFWVKRWDPASYYPSLTVPNDSFQWILSSPAQFHTPP
jgi:hypothetical protein